MTRVLLYALLVSTAAAAADPEAEVEPGAIPSDVKSAPAQSFRVPPGTSLQLKATGPASVRFALSFLGLGGASVAVGEIDGKAVTNAEVQPGASPIGLTVAVPAGRHAVTLKWPAGAGGDALASVSGVRLAKPMLALPGTEAALPLPGAQAKNDRKAPPALPLPGATAPKAPGEMLPLPGVEQKPAAKPAVAAAPPPAPVAKPATAPATPPAAEPASARSQAALAAPAAPSAQLMERTASARGPELWNLTAFVGGDRSTEDYTAASSSSRLGLQASRTINRDWIVIGEFGWRNSTQEYAIQQPGVSGRNSILDENRFDVSAAGGYDFGGRILSNNRLVLTALLGVKYVGIRNRAFPSDLVGPQVAGRAAFALSPAVVAQLDVGYTYNLSVSSSHSALGAPLGDFAIRAGLSLPLSGSYALSLNYQGDVLAFNYVYRVAHGAAVGLGYSFF